MSTISILNLTILSSGDVDEGQRLRRLDGVVARLGRLRQLFLPRWKIPLGQCYEAGVDGCTQLRVSVNRTLVEMDACMRDIFDSLLQWVCHVDRIGSCRTTID